MPRTTGTRIDHQQGGLALSGGTYTKLTDLMDELAFRGPMQEALVMRIANCGGFDDVITRIKRRRLYSKKMLAGAPAVDAVEGLSAARPRGKKKGKRPTRRTKPATGGGQPEDGTGGE